MNTNEQTKQAKLLLNNKVQKLNGLKCQQIKILLTTIEYSQVLFEIGARHYLGQKSKWYLIALLQLVKASLRLYIVNNSLEQIITTPAIMSLNRKKLQTLKKRKLPNCSGSDCDSMNANYYQAKAGHTSINDDYDLYSTYVDDENDEDYIRNNSGQGKSYRLKRSGRIIRKIDGAPTSIHDRSFNLQEEFGRYYKNSKELTSEKRKLLYGEYLYIAKPLIHLSAIGMFGERGWSQYMISLLLDLASINIYQRNRHLMTKKQQTILSYRSMNLCTYLLRTPFYERCCQRRMQRVLNFLQQNVPFARLICGPIQEYIPYWQNIYFHMWST